MDEPRRDEDKTMRTRDGLTVRVTYRDDDCAAASYAGTREGPWLDFLGDTLDEQREPYEQRLVNMRTPEVAHRDAGMRKGDKMRDVHQSRRRKLAYLAVLRGDLRALMPLRAVAGEYSPLHYNTPINRYHEQANIGHTICTVSVYLGDSLLVRREVAGLPNATLYTQSARRIERDLVRSTLAEAREG